MTEKKLRKDEAIAIETGNDDLAVRLASMRVGESVDIVQADSQRTQTLTARDIAPKPARLYDEGIGAGRAPGIPQYTTRLEREPLGIPGHGKTTPGQSSTTARLDSAVDLSSRVPDGGTDEQGLQSFGPEKSGPGNPEPNPFKDSDAGGPKFSENTTNKTRPHPGLHPEDEQ